MARTGLFLIFLLVLQTYQVCSVEHESWDKFFEDDWVDSNRSNVNDITPTLVPTTVKPQVNIFNPQ